ncbi:MAG: ATP-binding protein [Gemmatimonadota bacterium]|nr:ATP-binding protein [Gemmatimonadota bacterium]
MIGLPGTLLALLLIWGGDHSSRVQWTATLVLLPLWVGVAVALRERVVRPLQTISNMLAALREGDFSIRARGARPDEALGLALLEVNTLSETLRQQRLGALEATALLRTVMGEIDVAVFAFDSLHILRLVNRGGERLLGQPAERLIGLSSAALGLAPYLYGPAPRTIDVTFSGGAGRWEVRRTSFRQGGLPHTLLVLADLSRALREEEREAWQRLIRVLSHEINNSLAPIKSIADSLERMLDRLALAAGAEPADDFRQGLAVIAGRSEALSRFMASYALLARLPRPEPHPLPVEAWARRVARLETRCPVTVVAGPDVTLVADGDQLDQLLINLVRNAADASLETGGGVRIGWTRNGTALEVWVEDDGPGLPETANLFVPFFTTKPEGSGIGLPLSRQIAEAHGGTVTLENRSDGRGAVARLRLPVEPLPSSAR